MFPLISYFDQVLVHSSYKIIFFGCCQIFYFKKDNPNANVSFHWFENQEHPIVHMHMLVWLKSLKQVNMNRIRASIPSDDSYVEYLVRLFFMLRNS